MTGKTSQKEPPSRREVLERQEQRLQQLLAEHPEIDAKAATSRMAASLNFASDLRETLDKDTNDKLDATLQKAIDSTFQPEIVKVSMEEAETLLVGHDELLGRFKDFLGQMSAQQWAEYGEAVRQAKRAST